MPVNFHVGDYVLWSRVDAKTHINKLAVKWIGPYRVISANANSFEIEHLLTGAIRTVHASRLKRYADSSLDVNEEILEHVANQDVYLTVEAFKHHRTHPTHFYEVLTGWEGLEDIEDSWEPIKIMHEDVPVKLMNYVIKAGDKDLSEYVARLESKTTRANHPAAPGPIVQTRKSTKTHTNKTKPSRQLNTKRGKKKQGVQYKHA